jgi:pyruvate/2-oxoglutarate dehydrogenase complex dihydrolipoamide acyltransferase (E2) component
MDKVDILQNNRINLAIALITGIGAITGVLLYLEQKKHSTIQKEIMDLDKNIKELQLRQLKNGKSNAS